MVAAQEAAKQFLRELPKHIEVGLVTFAGSSQVAQQATIDRALAGRGASMPSRCRSAPRSATPSSLCLAELFPDHGIDLGEMNFGPQRRARSLDEKAKAPPKQITRGAGLVRLGRDHPAERRPPHDRRRHAGSGEDGRRPRRIYVIGLGTNDGHAASDGMAIYLQLDEPTLREVARMTGGEYHHAGTAEALRSVYENLGSRLQVQTRETELTGLLALLAAVLIVIGSSLSLFWFGRIA